MDSASSEPAGGQNAQSEVAALTLRHPVDNKAAPTQRSDSVRSSGRSSASSGYFSETSFRASNFHDDTLTDIDEISFDKSGDFRSANQSLFDESATAAQSSPEKLLSDSSSVSSSENSPPPSLNSSTSDSPPSYCLCQSRVSPRSSENGYHADVVATQECAQTYITSPAAASSVFSKEEIEKWLADSRDHLEIGPSSVTPPRDTEQSHVNIDVNQTAGELTTSDEPPSNTLDVILDCSKCPNGSEEQIYRHMVNDPDSFENLKEYLADIGDLKLINTGCIILTFNIKSQQERDALERAFKNGTLQKKIENWLKSKTGNSSFKLNFGFLSLQEEKIENKLPQDTLDEPVEFTFCHCEKRWYWSYDRDQWYHVGTREIPRDGKMWHPMESDLRLMERLLTCDRSPKEKNATGCLICTGRKTDAIKVKDSNKNKHDTTRFSIGCDRQEICHKEISLMARLSGGMDSGYGSKCSSLSEEESCSFVNADEGSELNTIEVIEQMITITSTSVS